MDGYTYGYPTGGEHVCKACGVPVRNTEVHNTWHKEQATEALRLLAGILEAHSIPPNGHQLVAEYEHNDLFQTLARGLRRAADG